MLPNSHRTHSRQFVCQGRYYTRSSRSVPAAGLSRQISPCPTHRTTGLLSIECWADRRCRGRGGGEVDDNHLSIFSSRTLRRGAPPCCRRAPVGGQLLVLDVLRIPARYPTSRSSCMYLSRACQESHPLAPPTSIVPPSSRAHSTQRAAYWESSDRIPLNIHRLCPPRATAVPFDYQSRRGLAGQSDLTLFAPRTHCADVICDAAARSGLNYHLLRIFVRTALTQ